MPDPPRGRAMLDSFQVEKAQKKSLVPLPTVDASELLPHEVDWP